MEEVRTARQTTTPSVALSFTTAERDHHPASGPKQGILCSGWTGVKRHPVQELSASVAGTIDLPPALEARVIRSRARDCPKQLPKKLVTAAVDVRKARENEEVYCTFSTRRLIELARRHAQLGDFPAALDLAIIIILQSREAGLRQTRMVGGGGLEPPTSCL
ncbi:MAG: CbbQ/NirQ/NorQ domain-containing protein [Planctomycetota bacterium]